jgi:hypothetical protein
MQSEEIQKKVINLLCVESSHSKSLDRVRVSEVSLGSCGLGDEKRVEKFTGRKREIGGML